jgi:hypothetical protein
MGCREIQNFKHLPQFQAVDKMVPNLHHNHLECTTQHLLLVSYYIIIIIHTRININTIIFVIRFKKEKRGNFVMLLSDW